VALKKPGNPSQHKALRCLGEHAFDLLGLALPAELIRTKSEDQYFLNTGAVHSENTTEHVELDFCWQSSNARFPAVA